MASLSKKAHRPSRTIGGAQENGSNAEKNCQECSVGKRPSDTFVGEGNRPNEFFTGNGERPNAPFGSGKKRSSASFVDKEESPM